MPEPLDSSSRPSGDTRAGDAPDQSKRRAQHPWRVRDHALRQPLNALGLFCTALRVQPLSSEQQALVRGIAEAATTLEFMIDAWAAEEAAAEGDDATPRRTDLHPLEGRAERAQSAETAELADAAAAAAGRIGAPPTSLGEPISLAGAKTAGLAPAPPSGTASDPPPPRTVVIVDDDPASRLSMAMLLEASGAQVVDLDGVAALETWLASAAHPCPRLAIVDFHLGPSGNGCQALASLRAAWAGVTIPALLITGDEDALRASLALADVQPMRKPVPPQALLQAVETLLRS